MSYKPKKYVGIYAICFPKGVPYNRFVELEREVYSEGVQGHSPKEKYSMGWFFSLKLHLICNEKGEFFNFLITPIDVND